MKRHYLTLLLLLFTSLQFAHSQDVCIEPKNVNDYNEWLPEDGPRSLMK